MKTRVLAFACYILITARNFTITNTAPLLACVILIASAFGGRANQTVTLQTGWNWVGCSVNGPGGNNVNNASFLQVPDSLSYPNNAVLFVWNCSGLFSIYYYYNAADAAPNPAGWYDMSEELATDVIWNPGRGMFIYNSMPPATITFIGNPPTSLVFPPTNYCGCDHWSLLCAQTTNATSTYQDVTGFAPEEGSQVSFTVPTNGILATDTYSNGAWSPSTPILTNGQAAYFWVPCATNCLVTSVSLNTGYNHPAGTTYDIGVVDAFWRVVSDPDAGTTKPRTTTVITKNSAWHDPQADSQWISSYPTAEHDQNGVYVFQTQFCLETNYTNIVLGFCLYADDWVRVSVNGTNIFQAGDTTHSVFNGPLNCTNLDITSLCHAGENYFEVWVHNEHNVAMGLNLTGSVSGPGLVVDKAECCQPRASVSGQKFDDLNGNGVWDAGEPVLTNWTIHCDGLIAQTDVNGYYYFLNLAAGPYTVWEEPQPGWTQTAPAGGSYIVTLGQSQATNNLNFGNWHTNTDCIHIFCPSNIVTECTGSGAVVPFTVTATNLCSTNMPRIYCEPPSTFLFPVGITTVHCTAYDNSGDSATCSFTVTVQDTTPPAITCPSNIVVSACTNIQVFYTNTASDVCCGTNVTVVCTPTNGSYFAPDTTTPVNCVTTDCNGNSNSCSFTVTVLCTNCVPAPTNLVLWLPFDETNGTSSANLASPANYGTQVGSPTPVLGSYVANSLNFNGANQYVTVPDYPAIEIGTKDFTIDAWVECPTNSGSATRTIVEKRVQSGTNYYGFVFDTYGNTLLLQLADGSWDNYYNVASVPTDGKWHFVAVTVQRMVTNGLQFYVDGLPTGVPFNPTRHEGSLSNNVPLVVGALTASSTYWLGGLDEVEMFSRALASNEIHAIYSAGSAGKCKPCCYLSRLRIVRMTGNSIEIIWGGCGILEESASLLGPWTPIENAASPYIIQATGTAMFYRLECP